MTTTTQLTGRHVLCTAEQYNAGTMPALRGAWRHSQVELLVHDDHKEPQPELFEGLYISGCFEQPQKDAFDLGIVAHTCLLEPGGFGKVCEVIPPEVLNKQGHRRGKAWEDFQREHPGKILMKETEANPSKASAKTIIHMIRNVRGHVEARKLLDACLYREHTIVWRDPATGLKLRARLDMVCGDCPIEPIIVTLADFKTTRQVTQVDFWRDGFAYGYHRQAAWYWDAAESMGWEVEGFRFIAVDKSPAHTCNVYQLGPGALERGRRENAAARADLKRRLKTKDWRGATADRVLPFEWG